MEETNILILDNSAIGSSLAKKLATTTEAGKIFIAAGNNRKSDYYENIDIRENDITGLLKFVLENNIKLTIPISQKALKSDIVSFFQSNGQAIFAPESSVCNLFFNRINEKKFLYKLHIPCAKFGVFNKISVAQDYLNNANYPVIISSNEKNILENDKFICPTTNIANQFLQDLYQKGEEDFLIEEYIYGKNFTMYFVTDGFTVLPITTVCSEKFNKKGLIFDGLGGYSPADLLYEQEREIFEYAQKIISYFGQKEQHYIGFLGIEGTITKDGEIYIQRLKTFFENHDIEMVLNSIEEDILNIIFACINGSFSDEYNQIKTNNLYSASSVIKINENLQIENCENIELIDKNTAVITEKASTLSRAKKYLKENLKMYNIIEL